MTITKSRSFKVSQNPSTQSKRKSKVKKQKKKKMIKMMQKANTAHRIALTKKVKIAPIKGK